MTQVNPEYKDRLFAFIFGREENKAWTLSLYNAVNETALRSSTWLVVKASIVIAQRRQTLCAPSTVLLYAI